MLNERKIQEFVMFISRLFLRYPREAFCPLIYEYNISMALPLTNWLKMLHSELHLIFIPRFYSIACLSTLCSIIISLLVPCPWKMTGNLLPKTCQKNLTRFRKTQLRSSLFLFPKKAMLLWPTQSRATTCLPENIGPIRLPYFDGKSFLSSSVMKNSAF